ncbi:hypothetical protein BZA05DRAFT_200658 [Tricharina praecox]|uniref:uncharacterized protein n=1 Tax=Tricharina praecox TaxID=43433 RepID=UPI00221F4961|nr:uncharacterized protein BZA05DRAFT_200658 [Tricharina praecox]KAI5856433.1 hypothetical protein BZA05DRAFT_200658 [Tricharina praecox]
MDSPRSDRASRRRSEGGRSSSRRRTADCEDEPSSSNSGRPPPSRRGSGIAAPIVTVRASANRTPTTAESTTPTLRIPPEEAQAQIITLESQIERLQLRLLENRLLESRESARANRMRVELETLPPPPLFDRSPMTPLVRTPNNGLRTPNNGPASPRTPGGVRLSQNTAGGANGSGHDGEDMRRNIRQRLGDLVRDLPSEQNSPVPYFPSPIIGLRETVRPRSMALGSETTARPSGWPRRRSVAETPSEPPWAELATRASRGLWRLEDGQDIDSELESLHESAARRHLYAANRSLATATREAERSRIMGNRTPSREDPPLILSPMDAEAEERLRAVWDDHDGDDYASSQISSL